MKRALVLFLLVVLILPACTSPTPAGEALSTHPPGNNPKKQPIIDDSFTSGLILLDESATLTSFIISHNDTIVFEKYYNGGSESQSTNVQSVTKSVISALTGVALREGYIKGVDQKLSEFFPSHFLNSLHQSKQYC